MAAFLVDLIEKELKCSEEVSRSQYSFPKGAAGREKIAVRISYVYRIFFSLIVERSTNVRRLEFTRKRDSGHLLMVVFEIGIAFCIQVVLHKYTLRVPMTHQLTHIQFFSFYAD